MKDLKGVKNKNYLLYLTIGLVVIMVLMYLCFSFVLAELNPFKWEQSIRGAYVFAVVSIFVLSIPVSQLIELNTL